MSEDSYPKYPDVTVQLSGGDGNAMAVISAVQGALRRAGAPEEEREEFFEQALSGDYQNVLSTAMKWVNVA